MKEVKSFCVMWCDKTIICLAVTLLITLQGFSQSKELNLSLGKDASTNKEYNTAVFYFNQVLKEDPNNIEAYMDRAHAYNMLGQYENAIEDYNYVLSKEPENEYCFWGLANIYDTWFNDKYKAIDYFTKSIESSLKKDNPDFAGRCYFMRARLKNLLGDENGYNADVKKGAQLGNRECQVLLDMDEKMRR